MKFENRLKKEVSESIIKALLVDSGYRVVAAGIEYLVREAECLSTEEFLKLGFSKSLTSLPDFVVMNRWQSEMHCVDVKYRTDWDPDILESVESQVKLVGKLTLVCFNANPRGSSTEVSGGTHLRACELKHKGNKYIINRYKNGSFRWCPVTEVLEDFDPWFRLAPIQYVFEGLKPSVGINENTLKAVVAMKSIMDYF